MTDTAYQTIRVVLEREPKIGMVEDGATSPNPLDYRTADIDLRVTVEEVSGMHVTIRKFGENYTVRKEELHATPLTDRVYDARRGSPYPTLDDVIAELSAEVDS